MLISISVLESKKGAWMILLFNELLKKYSFSSKSFLPSSPKFAFGNSYEKPNEKKDIKYSFFSDKPFIQPLSN